MSTFTGAEPAVTVDRHAKRSPAADRSGARRRAMRVTAVITFVSLLMLAYLLVRGHTHGEQIWGPITAAAGALAGVLSFAFAARDGGGRAARTGLIVLWLTVAFLGLGGYSSHRLASSAAGSEPGQGPPIAPLMFLGFGIAGTVSVRSASKGH